MNAAGWLGDEDHPPPQAGDVLVCISCAGVCVLDESGYYRKPTAELAIHLAGDPNLIELVRRVQMFRASKQ